MELFKGVPGKIFIAIFTIVVSLFTYSTKKNYDNWVYLIDEVKLTNISGKVHEKYFNLVEENIVEMKLYSQTLGNIHQITKDKDQFNPKDTVQIIAQNAIRKFENIVSIGENYIKEYPELKIESIKMFHDLMSNSLRCWKTLYEYCTMTKSSSTTQIQLQQQLKGFNSCYENTYLNLKRDFDSNSLAWDIKKTSYWWEYAAFLFWSLINIATLVFIVMMSYFGISVYLLNEKES